MDLRIYWDDMTKLGFAIGGFFLLLAVLIGLGEYFGWWNDWGEIGLSIVAVVGLVVTFLTLFVGAERRQVAAVAEGVELTNRTLGGMDTKLGGVDTKLGGMDTKLGGMDTKLGGMDTKLGGIDGKLDTLDAMDAKLETIDTKLGKLDELDVIQAELDVQTGALKEQTLVLREIRDRL